MTIHKEGKELVWRTFFILVLLNVASFYFIDSSNVKVILLLLSVVFYFIILQFFRSPKRSITYNDNYIIAPADGKIVVIERTTEEEYFKDRRIQISIFMSPFNVHINWYPISGLIKFLKYHKGKYLVAWHPKASTENERTTIVIEKDSKRTILVRQIAGALAKRIIYYPRAGDKVRQGAQLGFIKFGSRVDVFVPENSLVNVELNQKVKGGVTVLAEIK